VLLLLLQSVPGANSQELTVQLLLQAVLCSLHKARQQQWMLVLKLMMQQRMQLLKLTCWILSRDMKQQWALEGWSCRQQLC
jgi:hypothetical protein